MSQLSNVVLPTPWPDLIDTRSCRPTASRAAACHGSGVAPRTSVTNRGGLFLLRIQAVCQLFPETIADPPPKVHEGLTCFDVDVCLFRQEVCNHPNVDLWLALPHEGDGLRSGLIEVRLQGLKELSAEAIARALRTTLRIATLPRLEGHNS